jgi:hypothetical protein
MYYFHKEVENILSLGIKIMNPIEGTHRQTQTSGIIIKNLRICYL